MSGPDPRWTHGPRARIDTLHHGQRFLAYDGRTYTYLRKDGALSGVHHVLSEAGESTCFAGCAEGVVQS
jgi:hypothetical protein